MGRFCDLVQFIEKQVNILTDPIFGNIIDQTIRNAAKTKPVIKIGKPKSSSSSFATSVSMERSQTPNMLAICLFCAKEHLLDVCPQLKKKKIKFIKEQGTCFGCLVQ